MNAHPLIKVLANVLVNAIRRRYIIKYSRH